MKMEHMGREWREELGEKETERERGERERDREGKNIFSELRNDTKRFPGGLP